jgi:hypothetical protein
VVKDLLTEKVKFFSGYKRAKPLVASLRIKQIVPPKSHPFFSFLQITSSEGHLPTSTWLFLKNNKGRITEVTFRVGLEEEAVELGKSFLTAAIFELIIMRYNKRKWENGSSQQRE